MDRADPLGSLEDERRGQVRGVVPPKSVGHVALVLLGCCWIEPADLPLQGFHLRLPPPHQGFGFVMSTRVL